MEAIDLQKELLARAGRLRNHIRQKLPSDLLSVLGEDDILQEAFAVAFRQVKDPRFRVFDSFDAWIFTIVNQRVTDNIKTYRRAKRGGRMKRQGLLGDLSQYNDLLDLLSSPGETPSSAVARDEALVFIRNAVEDLPNEQRRAIVLRHLEGKSYEDISAVMDKTVPAVRGLIQRAMQNMRLDLGRASRFFSDASQTMRGEIPGKDGQ